ncbi:TolC family protein [Rhodobacterales bacterium HKCCSP123]|nr:TolC family protein [Rhodobacterales bacterium HKCCSP123]
MSDYSPVPFATENQVSSNPHELEEVPQIVGASTPTGVAIHDIASAMQAAVINSNVLEQNEYLATIEDEDLAQAVGRLRPVVEFVASANEDFRLGDRNSNASIIVEQVIFSGGGRRAQISAASEIVDATQQQLRAIEQQVRLSAVQAYVSVWREFQIMELREGSFLVTEGQLAAARNRVSAGQDTQIILSQVEARLAESQAEFLAAEGEFQIARSAFLSEVGQDPGSDLRLGPMPVIPGNQTLAEQFARTEHPNVRALRHEIAAAEFSVNEARSTYRPSLSLVGRVDETLVTSGTSGPGTGGSIGLTLTQPIFSGGQRRSRERQAVAQMQSLYASLERQIDLNVRAAQAAWTGYEIAARRIEIANSRINSLTEAFQAVRRTAEVGAATTTEVLDVEDDLLRAQIDLVNARADQVLAAYEILEASGLLSSD